MPKQYRDWAPHQSLLLPRSLHDWLPEGHFAYFVLDAVEELDISPIERAIHAKDPRGTRPYAPRMMVALLVYAYAEGVFSSRRIARACSENVAFRVITGDSQPHFTAIAAFRRTHRAAFEPLFREVLRLCDEAGMVRGQHVHIDGTKIKANASKHKAMSYEGMKKAEERLQKEVDALLDRAEATDGEEDARLGDKLDESQLKSEVERRETRRAWIRRNREELEAETRRARAAELRERADARRTQAEMDVDPKKEARHREQAAADEEKAAKLDPDPPEAPSPTEALPLHRPAHTADGKPKPEAQRNFTDPDSRIMQGKQGAYEQAYNGQIVVDESGHVILAHGLSNQASDTEYLPSMLARTIANLDEAPESITGDAGYFSKKNLRSALHQDVTPYLATGRERRSWPPPTPAEGAPPRGSDARTWMAHMLRTEQGQRQMRKRKSTVELVFGCIKAAMGFRTFMLRGLEKVRAEWALVCLAYNVRKLHHPDLA